MRCALRAWSGHQAGPCTDARSTASRSRHLWIATRRHAILTLEERRPDWIGEQITADLIADAQTPAHVVVDALVDKWAAEHPIKHRGHVRALWQTPLDDIALRLPTLVRLFLGDDRTAFAPPPSPYVMPVADVDAGFWGEDAWTPTTPDTDEELAEADDEEIDSEAAYAADVAAAAGDEPTPDDVLIDKAEPLKLAAVRRLVTEVHMSEPDAWKALKTAMAEWLEDHHRTDGHARRSEIRAAIPVLAQAIVDNASGWATVDAATKVAAATLATSMSVSLDEASRRLGAMAGAWSARYAADHDGCAPGPDAMVRAIHDIAAAMIAIHEAPQATDELPAPVDDDAPVDDAPMYEPCADEEVIVDAEVEEADVVVEDPPMWGSEAEETTAALQVKEAA